MSPFDLSGPQFLGFYLALMAAVALSLVLVRRAFEGGPVPKLPFVDPYLIAQLRGGAAEAVRVCTLALLDRGLLTLQTDQLYAPPHSETQVRRPLERAIIAALRVPRSGYELIAVPEVLAGANSLHSELAELGLAPEAHDNLRRFFLGLTGLGCLWFVAAVKLVIAFSRGRHNVGLLIMLALVSGLMVVIIMRHPRTARGDRLLVDLRTLFAGLRERSACLRGGGASQELALLSAVFGVAGLYGPPLAQWQKLFPKATSSSSSGCGSSCSSSSSSCGSSCGGGCGGGCGGCGS